MPRRRKKITEFTIGLSPSAAAFYTHLARRYNTTIEASILLYVELLADNRILDALKKLAVYQSRVPSASESQGILISLINDQVEREEFPQHYAQRMAIRVILEELAGKNLTKGQIIEELLCLAEEKKTKGRG